MKFELYRAADGWRWRLRAANRRTVADSGEAYTTRAHGKRAIMKTVDGMLAMFREHGGVQVVELAGAPDA
ncbi:MAG TPA: DUF1508 domain-containing protein [Thauera aminoaromatica]|jgi:uncharacterized protein YegP (UPF0339 family)|nr:DUF1508 domain-containing protein [Thauera aminoaromatica]